MTNKEQYIAEYVDEDTPFFHKPFWLDIVAKDNWDVALVVKNKAIIGSMPYVLENRRPGLYIVMPDLTPFLGPLIKIAPGSKTVTALSLSKKVITELYNQLPEFARYNQRWHHSMLYWLPLYWKGYAQTTRYTYVLDDLSNPENIWSGLRENIRTDIRKAEKTITIDREGNDKKALYDMLKLTFKRQKLDNPLTFDFLDNLVNTCVENNCCKMFIARDDAHQTHAAILVVWDSKTMYYLLGGGDPALRNSGATSLLLWEAIKFASGFLKQFDFEGSMIEPIERFFRGFGAQPKAYYDVSKTNSTVLKIKDGAKLIKEALFN